MMFKVWYSTESFADFIVNNTDLKKYKIEKNEIYESDAKDPKTFHTMPDHIKEILYLDAPDLIVEMNSEPIFSIEISTEAGTGHNAFQRFARIAASVEKSVPAFYIYPEAAIVNRKNKSTGKHTIKWDSINPLVFKALDEVMNIYNVPALLYYFPSDYRDFKEPCDSPNFLAKGLRYNKEIEYAGCPNDEDENIKNMFLAINEIIKNVIEKGVVEGRNNLMSNLHIRNQRTIMQEEFYKKRGALDSSPLTSTIEVPTEKVLEYLKKYESTKYKIGNLLKSRKNTIIYMVDAEFRGDPYPGCLAAIDYLKCREGKTFEERKNNLVMVWGEASIVDDKLVVKSSKGTSIKHFIKDVKKCTSKDLLTKEYSELRNEDIPRYYMQVRHGSTYSKVKHIRVYSYFADAVIFEDGSLWRDG